MKGESPFSKKGQKKKDLFAEVCNNYSPSFCFFIHGTFQRHGRSTRSVAINSMVGSVLAIGDRHLSNILIHTKTGAVYYTSTLESYLTKGR
jgi:phosphatidylinositol kinase/protein kinase (PI-3  family)